MKSKFYLLSLLLLVIISTSCGNTSQHLKIASYNVRNARGMDNVTDFDRVSTVINDMNADAVAIQELDSATERSNGIVVLEELAKRTNMHASFNGSIEFQGGKYGNGILTKEKPLQVEAIELPGREEKRSLLIVELKHFVLCCTHLSLNEEDRQSSVEIIQQHTNKYTSKPIFLVGDLNAGPNSKEIKYLSNNWTMLNDPAKHTFPSDNPDVTIDYLFLKNNQNFKHTLINTDVVAEPMASDHRPLLVELKINQN